MHGATQVAVGQPNPLPDNIARLPPSVSSAYFLKTGAISRPAAYRQPLHLNSAFAALHTGQKPLFCKHGGAWKTCAQHPRKPQPATAEPWFPTSGSCFSVYVSFLLLPLPFVLCFQGFLSVWFNYPSALASSKSSGMFLRHPVLTQPIREIHEGMLQGSDSLSNGSSLFHVWLFLFKSETEGVSVVG